MIAAHYAQFRELGIDFLILVPDAMFERLAAKFRKLTEGNEGNKEGK